MRVVALGGAGAMGRHAVRCLVSSRRIEEIVVADRDAQAASGFARTCGPKVRAIGLDVEDSAALERLLSHSDAVLNAVGPFFRFGVRVLRSAIATGCHYLDINDDWEPTAEMLKLDPEARAAGITAIVGMGASPGVSNLLAVKAAQSLERTEELLKGWSLDEAELTRELAEAGADAAHRGPSAALVHWLHQCSGTIRIYRDGAPLDTSPLEERRIDYPGVGSASVWTVGHPEPITLPRWHPELRSSANVMVIPRWLVGVLRGAAHEIDARRRTPEEVFEPDVFFDALAPFCSPPLEDARSMVLVTDDGPATARGG